MHIVANEITHDNQSNLMLIHTPTATQQSRSIIVPAMKLALMKCFTESRAHGLPRIAKSHTPLLQTLWLILTVTVTCLFIYHTSTLYAQFVSQTIAVSINPNAVPFPQPDILVCLNKPFAVDYLRNPPAYSVTLMTRVVNQIKSLDSQMTNIDLRLLKLIKNDHTMFLWNSINVTELYQALFYRGNELFLQVYCNGVTITLSGIEMNWQYLACWRISPDVCSLSNPLNSMIMSMYVHTYNLNITYPNGFNTTLNGLPLETYKFIEPNDFDTADSVVLYFLPRGENIREDSSKVTMMGGTSAEIRIQSNVYSYQNRSAYVCVNQKTNYTVYNILAPGNDTLTFNDTITCMSVLVQRQFYQRFHCVFANYPIPIDIPYNTQYCLNVSNNVNMMIEFLTQYLSLSYQMDALKKCQSEMSCSETKYRVRTTYMDWPLQTVMQQYMLQILPYKILFDAASGTSDPGLVELANNVKGTPVSNLILWRQNLYQVVINPGEYNSTQIVETIPYLLKNFFADTGGIMGFYVGASILTLCEIFAQMHYYLVLGYLSYVVKKVKKKILVEDDTEDSH